MWEFDISPANWKISKIYEWDGVFAQCINSLKIAIIIYRGLKISFGMLLTNEIDNYMQQWKYIKFRQAKTEN